MLVINNQNITLTRGDSAVIELTVMNGDQEYDYSSDEVVFSVKKFFNDSKPIITKTFDENGQVTFEPDDTKDLQMGDYWYDVKLTHTDEAVEEGEEDTVIVDTVITAHKFTIGAEVHSN